LQDNAALSCPEGVQVQDQALEAASSHVHAPVPLWCGAPYGMQGLGGNRIGACPC
jgi:hypothetical protein